MIAEARSSTQVGNKATRALSILTPVYSSNRSSRQTRSGAFHASRQAQLASFATGVVASHLVVSRKTLQIGVLVCLVAFVLAYPVIESADHWDPPGPASDSELEFIGVLTFAGAIFLLTQLLTILALAISAHALPGLCFRTLRKHILAYLPRLTASPPLPLRI